MEGTLADPREDLQLQHSEDIQSRSEAKPEQPKQAGERLTVSL